MQRPVVFKKNENLKMILNTHTKHHRVGGKISNCGPERVGDPDILRTDSNTTLYNAAGKQGDKNRLKPASGVLPVPGTMPGIGL